MEEKKRSMELGEEENRRNKGLNEILFCSYSSSYYQCIYSIPRGVAIVDLKNNRAYT